MLQTYSLMQCEFDESVNLCHVAVKCVGCEWHAMCGIFLYGLTLDVLIACIVMDYLKR